MAILKPLILRAETRRRKALFRPILSRSFPSQNLVSLTKEEKEEEIEDDTDDNANSPVAQPMMAEGIHLLQKALLEFYSRIT
jgi:hypothetical protein